MLFVWSWFRFLGLNCYRCSLICDKVWGLWLFSNILFIYSLLILWWSITSSHFRKSGLNTVCQDTHLLLAVLERIWSWNSTPRRPRIRWHGVPARVALSRIVRFKKDILLRRYILMYLCISSMIIFLE